MSGLTLTSYEPALKILYPDEAVKNLVYKSNPFMALVAKDEGFYGESSKEPIVWGTPQNRSATFANANTINTTTLVSAFLLTRVTNYSMASIANEAMEASSKDVGAFMPALKTEMDNALLALGRSIATQLYRGGTGVVASISSTATVNSASTPVALASSPDIVNLENGMSIALSATDGGAVRTGTAYIVNIDDVAGTFLCSATPGGSPAALTSLISGAAAGDFVYANAGDRNAVVQGLRAWLPGSSVSLSDSFFSVNRSQNTRLSGVSYDGTGQSPEEALIAAASLIARQGGRPDYCFTSFQDWQNLVLATSSKQQYIQYTDVMTAEPGVTIGFQALTLTGPTGPLKVVPDMNCPAGSAYLLQMDTWKLKSLGPVVRLFNADGLTIIRDASSDSVLVRCFSYAQLSCRAPGWNCRVTFG